MTNTFKTLLKTSAALATLCVGSQSWGAHFIKANGTVLDLATATTVTPGKYANSTLEGGIAVTGVYTLESGKYTFFSNGAVDMGPLTLGEGSHVVFEGNGNITLTSAVFPAGKKIKVEFNNSGTVTWATANPTNSSPLHHIIFGPGCTGLTGINAPFNGALEAHNLDFALTTGPSTPYLYKKATKKVSVVDAASAVYMAD